VLAVRTVEVVEDGRLVRRDLEQFLAASDATQTSMSVAKSVLSALVGIAVGEGRIASVDDPITRHVPELAGRDRRFGRITLRHLLTMTSGLRYGETGGPWGDDTATCYAPDLRKLALEETEIVEAPGRRFHHNNYNSLLVGLALERAVGMPVAAYLQQQLWRPLGMEADGSWSLDSRASGFEKMESGLNGRAVDFAKLGLLYARGSPGTAASWYPAAGSRTRPSCPPAMDPPPRWPQLLSDLAGRLSLPRQREGRRNGSPRRG
jgi:CubicO group peptidase (beta-lactamase class C family)